MQMEHYFVWVVNQVVMIGGKQSAFTQQMEILCAWKVKLLVMERDVFRYTTILWRTIRHKAQTGLLMKNSIRAFGLIIFHLGGMEQKKNQIIS